jgi:hypothetical protein
MQRLTLSELLSITDIGGEQLKSMRRRGQFAAAFSCATASAALRYTASDCVAVLLASELAKSFGAKPAAELALMFGSAVLRAIADAEHGTTDAMLGIAELAGESDSRSAYVACSAADVGVEGYTVERVVTVNVSRLIRAVRDNAKRVGIDLSSEFMPAPTSTEFSEIMASYSELQAIVEHSGRRKRLADARRAGEQARMIGMGGAGHRKVLRASGTDRDSLLAPLKPGLLDVVMVDNSAPAKLST